MASESKDLSLSASNVFELSGGREMLTKERAEELVKPLLKAIEDKVPIVKVRLSGKSFSPEAAAVFAEALKQLPPSFKIADFADIIAGRKDDEVVQVLDTLCSALAAHTLDELVLSDNALAHRGIKACAAAFPTQTQLKRIFFNNNGLEGSAAGLISELVLSSQSDGKSKLESFEIFNNLLQDAGAQALAPLFAAAPSLRRLRMATTRVSQAGGLAVAQALRNLRNLTSLDLSDNSLGEEAGFELAKGLLAEQPHLKVLNLGDTGFGEEATQAVLKALSQTAPHLEELHLQASEISDELAVDVARCLRTKKHLRKLVLDDNQLGSKGARLIARAVARLPHLEEWSMTDADIAGEKAAHAIRQAVANKRNLRKLRLNANRIHADHVKLINAAVQNADDVVSWSDNEDDEEDDEDEESLDEETEVEEEEEPAKTDQAVDKLTEEISKLST